MLRELNPGVKVLPLNSVGTVERAMLRPGRQPAFWFLLGIAYFTAAYLTLRMVIGAGGNLADAVVNVFLGILLQAFPFLLIGVLLSSARYSFHNSGSTSTSQSIWREAFCSRPWPAFVCPCATAPQFRCSEAWFGRASPLLPPLPF